MMASPWSTAAWGAAFGLVNGWLSRFALRRALDRPDKVFYAVYAAGFFWRLVFLAASVWFLRYKKYIIILSFVCALIFTQMIFEVVPLNKNRKDGFKDHT